jgi:hypothetical protein
MVGIMPGLYDKLHKQLPDHCSDEIHFIYMVTAVDSATLIMTDREFVVLAAPRALESPSMGRNQTWES